MTDIVEGTVVEENTQAEPEVAAAAPQSVAVARRERRSEVIRPLDLVAVVESMELYQEMLPKLLNDTDYQGVAGGKRFVKKSGWRKIATAFDLDVQLIRSTVERDDSGQPLRAEVWARAIAPSGRSMDGDGYCAVDESRFNNNKGKLENDLRATATTRAMNRAISGLVGMGDVSAEEMDKPEAGPAYGPKYTGPGPDVGNAIAALVGFENVNDIVQQILGVAGYMPQIVAEVLLAASEKRGNVVAPEIS